MTDAHATSGDSVEINSGGAATSGSGQRRLGGIANPARVFVSHTSDLAAYPAGRSYVQAALDAVARAGMAPVDMRYFAARDGQPADYCRQRVRRCDVYVAMVGFRYGSSVPGETVSYTELEFAEATAAGLGRLVFLLAESGDLPVRLVDTDRTAVDAFRRRLRDAGLIIAEFTTADGLELQVFHALTELVEANPAGVRCALPADTAAFTGRDRELDQITTVVIDAATAGGVVAIHAIDGMPGVGKTALAVRAAHRRASQFPDGQLFVDLHAHTPGQTPTDPATALAALLAADGLGPRYLPDTLDERAVLWRDRLATKNVLLVLDNAASSDQVAPLLPGHQTCLVLITSRRHLGDLPGKVEPIALNVLPPAQARAMFLHLAPRAARDPVAEVDELVALAGRLPLAISLLAKVYTRHPAWTLHDLLSETRTRLLSIRAENATIAAAFDLSYRHLPADSQRFLRHLGLHPGTEIESYAAAALTGLSLGEAATQLDALHSDNLLTEISYRRYGMHDLIRQYARTLATTDPAQQREEAVARLLDYYQHTASLAVTRLTRPILTTPDTMTAVEIPNLATPTQSLVWMRIERANLLACLAHTDDSQRVVALTAGLAEILRLDGPWDEAITLHTTATQAAQHLDDRLGQANALMYLGDMRRLTGNHPGAMQAVQKALSIYRDLDDRRGQANTLITLANIRLVPGDYPGAIQALQQALELHRDLHDRSGQANALARLGAVQNLTGNYREAAQTLQQALKLHRDLDDLLGRANVLINLGHTRRLTGDYSGAIQVLQQALDIYHDLGHRHGQANTLTNLGNVRGRTRDYSGAIQALQQALDIYHDLGHRHGQANALNNLGHIQRLTGDSQGAAQTLQQALDIYREFGDPGGEVEILNETGTLHRISNNLGRAMTCHRQALNLAQQIDSPLDEAHALAGLGRCAIIAGLTAEGTRQLREALAIFQRIGAAEAAEVATELEELS